MLKEAPADETTAEFEQGFMHGCQAFPAHAKAFIPMQPSDGSLYHPARLAQAAAMLSSTPRNLRVNPPLPQRPPMRVRVIGTVGLDKLGSALGRAEFAANRRNPIHQGQQLRHVVTVGGAEDYRNRDALCVRKKVMLRAGTTAIGWVRSSFFPAPTARMEELSAMARLKSMRSASRSFDSSTWCSRSHTPARCHAFNRRQQLEPLPQPISKGSMFQGIPVRNTNRIPAKAARFLMGKRPGYFLRRRLGAGNNGSINVQSSSSISGFGIAPLKGKQCRS